MRLSLHADYALRALVYLATQPGRFVSTQEVSDAYGISKHHLVRVAQTLGRAGYVRLHPGRNGGLELAREPADIRLGQVFLATEPQHDLVECFDREHNTCPIAPVCSLKGVLDQARRAFVAELDRHTLADIAGGPKAGALAAHFLGAAAARGEPRRAERRARKP